MNKIIIIACLFLFGCVTPHVYQIVDVSISNPAKLGSLQDSIYLESNFWANGADLTLKVVNKSSQTWTIDLEKSFFIYNDCSFPIYQPKSVLESRTITSTAGSAKSNTIYQSNTSISSQESSTRSNTSSAVSISTTSIQNTKQTEYLPYSFFPIAPSTYRDFQLTYNLTSKPYTHCDLFLKPYTDSSSRVFFSNENSPSSFYYYLSLKNNSGEVVELTSNKYFISSLIIITEEFFSKRIKKIRCGKHVLNQDGTMAFELQYPYETPLRFYILK